MTGQTLILGLGNVLLTDEGAGAAVLRALEPAAAADPDLELLDGGTLSFTLSGPIGDAARLVVVDAAALGEPPGTVRVLEGEDLDDIDDDDLNGHFEQHFRVLEGLDDGAEPEGGGAAPEGHFEQHFRNVPDE